MTTLYLSATNRELYTHTIILALLTFVDNERASLLFLIVSYFALFSVLSYIVFEVVVEASDGKEAL